MAFALAAAGGAPPTALASAVAGESDKPAAPKGACGTPQAFFSPEERVQHAVFCWRVASMTLTGICWWDVAGARRASVSFGSAAAFNATPKKAAVREILH